MSYEVCAPYLAHFSHILTPVYLLPSLSQYRRRAVFFMLICTLQLLGAYYAHGSAPSKHYCHYYAPNRDVLMVVAL